MTPEDKQRDINISKKVIERDGECLICGKNYNLAPHHIVPRGNRKCRWKLRNLITLCFWCHRKLHDNHDFKMRVYSSAKIRKIARAYIQKLGYE